MRIEVQKAQLNELKQLQQICINAYSQNFAHHWNEGGLEWYIDQQFSDSQLMQAIESPKTDYYIIYKDGLPVGFCKLGYSDQTWLELEKIYVLPIEKGNGIGKTVLEMIISLAKGKDKTELVLYVIDNNEAAISFYQRNGFSFVKKTRLELPYFKEELKGAWQMVKQF